MSDALTIRPIVAEDLSAIAALMRSVHGDGTRLTEGYLRWQYIDNPDGLVVGFNAWDGDVLAAHYACMPVMMEGERWLWSLNTATHPDYRGQGLFPRLAEMTYERGKQEGFAAVIGVANAMSASGFVRKLGFTELGRLGVWVNIFTKITTKYVARRFDFGYRLKHLGKAQGCLELTVVRHKGVPVLGKTLPGCVLRAPHIYVGLRRPDRMIGFKLPEKWKPSPWVAIVRELSGTQHDLGMIQVEALDSDSI